MIKIYHSQDPARAAAQRNIEIIESQLTIGQRVTWLLAGGSAVNVYKKMDGLLNKGLDFSKLTISLGDERYSNNPNHKDATWPIFEKLDFFKDILDKGAVFYNILSGLSLEQDADRFNKFLNNKFEQIEYIFCNLGLGTDGHTAGIIPIEDRKLFNLIYKKDVFAVGHTLGGKHPKRITITPKLIERSNKITMYLIGNDKSPVLKNMNTKRSNKEISEIIHEFPALVNYKRSAEVYTDIN